MSTEMILFILWFITGFCGGLLTFIILDVFFYKEATTELDIVESTFYEYGYGNTICCKYGPIVEEKYCPMCGKKIIRNEDNTTSE